MKLIGSYTSPFVRKISVIMMEKGITFEFVNENPWPQNSHVPNYNPLGKVPALVVSADEVWFESSVIGAYLEQLGQAPAFMPSSPLAALKVRQLEALADGVCDAALLIVREQLRPADQQSEELLTRQREKIERGLDALEKAAASGESLNGESINLADIATGCTLGYLNFRHVAPNWNAGRPALVKLMETLLQRDSFARTAPPAP